MGHCTESMNKGKGEKVIKYLNLCNTVLGVKVSHGNDITSYAEVNRTEVEHVGVILGPHSLATSETSALDEISPVLPGSTWRRRTRGVKPGGNGGLGLSHENFNPFHPRFPLKKLNIPPLWHAALFSPSGLKHCSTKMGSLDIQPLYSTLCPKIASTCST